MATGHRHHAASHPIDQARQHELTMLLAQPWFEQAVRGYDREDCDHDIPYAGGSGTDWRTIYWDRHLCQAIEQGRFVMQGRAIDPRPAGRVHEATEGAIIHNWEQVRQLLGWPERADKYTSAHDVADVAERHAAEHLGWPWDDYQAAWEPFIRLEEREQIVKPPANLLLDAYQGTPLYAHLAKFQQGGAQGKLTHAQAGYHSGHGRTGSHCSICRYFVIAAPPDCMQVMQPIRPDDGCKLFEPRQGRAQTRGRSNAQAQH